MHLSSSWLGWCISFAYQRSSLYVELYEFLKYLKEDAELTTNIFMMAQSLRLDTSSLTSSTRVTTKDKGIVHNSGRKWKLTEKRQEVLKLIEQSERCFK